MKKQTKKQIIVNSSPKGNEEKNVKKTRQKFFLSIGGIVATSAIIIGVSIGITIAKKEVKNVT